MRMQAKINIFFKKSQI